MALMRYLLPVLDSPRPRIGPGDPLSLLLMAHGLMHAILPDWAAAGTLQRSPVSSASLLPRRDSTPPADPQTTPACPWRAAIGACRMPFRPVPLPRSKPCWAGHHALHLDPFAKITCPRGPPRRPATGAPQTAPRPAPARAAPRPVRRGRPATGAPRTAPRPAPARAGRAPSRPWRRCRRRPRCPTRTGAGAAPALPAPASRIFSGFTTNQIYLDLKTHKPSNPVQRSLSWL